MRGGHVVGVGASRGCPPRELQDLVEAALAAAGLRPAQVGALASVDLKGDERAVLALAAAHGWPLRLFGAAALAAAHGWPLRLFGAAALAAVAVPTPSATVARHVGTPSVAEAAALLAAGARARIVLAKQRARHATCAIAAVEGSHP